MCVTQSIYLKLFSGIVSQEKVGKNTVNFRIESPGTSIYRAVF